MTKERLKELIEQKGKVYTIVSGIAIEEVELDEAFIGYNIKQEPFLRSKDFRWIDIDRLFETKEQAEWALKMVAERTERFEPPMWADIKDEWNFYFMKMGIPHHFGIEKSNNIYISKCEYSCEYMSGGYEVLYNTEATKENYEKACEIVRDLFKRESNGKNS